MLIPKIIVCLKDLMYIFPDWRHKDWINGKTEPQGESEKFNSKNAEDYLQVKKHPMRVLAFSLFIFLFYICSAYFVDTLDQGFYRLRWTFGTCGSTSAENRHLRSLLSPCDKHQQIYGEKSHYGLVVEV